LENFCKFRGNINANDDRMMIPWTTAMDRHQCEGRLPARRVMTAVLVLATLTSSSAPLPGERLESQARASGPRASWRPLARSGLQLRGGTSEYDTKSGDDAGSGGVLDRDYFGARHAAAKAASGDDGWDIEDASLLADSPECGKGSTPVVDSFLTPSRLHDLEAPIRRKALRNPKGYYVYNRRADRWEQRGWDPVALPGEDQFNRMFWQRQHPMHRTSRRANETLEDFVRRCPCWPPYCRKCPLRPTPSLTASALVLHERITGSKPNISSSLRCGAVTPFSPEAAEDLGGYCPPRSGTAHSALAVSCRGAFMN